MSINKVLLEHNTYILPKVALIPKYQTGVTVTNTLTFKKPRTFTIGLFTKKILPSLTYNIEHVQSRFTAKTIFLREEKDGRVGGQGAHFFPQTQQNYIYR